MASAAEQFIEINQSSVQTFREVAERAHASVEQWTALHLSTSRTALDVAWRHAEASLSAKEVSQWVTLQSEYVKELTAKATGYGQNLFNLWSEGGAAISQSVEARLAQTNSSIARAVESLEKNAPAGTEAAFAVIKSAVTSGQGIIETAKSSAQRAVDAAQSAIAAAAQQSVVATTRTNRKK